MVLPFLYKIAQAIKLGCVDTIKINIMIDKVSVMDKIENKKIKQKSNRLSRSREIKRRSIIDDVEEKTKKKLRNTFHWSLPSSITRDIFIYLV